MSGPEKGRCNSLSCPPGQLAPGGEDNQGGGQDIPGQLTPRGEANRGWLALRGASCPGGKINWDTGLVVILPQRHNLGAGASAWAAATGRASHTPLFNCYGTSNRNIEGWIICLQIPIFRRMRCGGRIIPSIFLLVTDGLRLYFHLGIIHQIFHPPGHLKHLLMVLNHLKK